MTIASLPNGGAVFAGKSGRNTADACEANARETTRIAATAHLMDRALIKIRQDDKYNFFLVLITTAVSTAKRIVGEGTFNFAISRFRIIFHAHATV
jgi:hypothetical protein